MLKRADIEILKREFVPEQVTHEPQQDDIPFPNGPEDYGLSRDTEFDNAGNDAVPADIP